MQRALLTGALALFIAPALHAQFADCSRCEQRKTIERELDARCIRDRTNGYIPDCIEVPMQEGLDGYFVCTSGGGTVELSCNDGGIQYLPPSPIWWMPPIRIVALPAGCPATDRSNVSQKTGAK